MNIIKLVTKKMVDDKAREIREEILAKDEVSCFDYCYVNSRHVYYRALRRIIEGFGFSGKNWILKAKSDWVLFCGKVA